MMTQTIVPMLPVVDAVPLAHLTVFSRTDPSDMFSRTAPVDATSKKWPQIPGRREKPGAQHLSAATSNSFTGFSGDDRRPLTVTGIPRVHTVQ
ncbi:unnamed protein product, partial [Polarella glacialis]